MINREKNQFGDYTDPRVQRNKWLAQAHPDSLYLLAHLANTYDRMPTATEIHDIREDVRSAHDLVEVENKARDSRHRIDPRSASAFIRQNNRVPSADEIRALYSTETREQIQREHFELIRARERLSGAQRTLAFTRRGVPSEKRDAQIAKSENQITELKAEIADLQQRAAKRTKMTYYTTNDHITPRTDPMRGSFIDKDGVRRKYVDGKLCQWTGNAWIAGDATRVTDSAASDSRSAREKYLARLASDNAAALARTGQSAETEEAIAAAMSKVENDPDKLLGEAASAKRRAERLVAELARKNAEALK